MNAIGCPICDNPEKATWQERVDHGCSLPGEVKKCTWCGKPHKDEGMPSGAMWCNETCRAAHEAANPDCDWFRGWKPIADTMPGGALDGVWEDSGFTLSPRDEIS